MRSRLVIEEKVSTQKLFEMALFHRKSGETCAHLSDFIERAEAASRRSERRSGRMPPARRGPVRATAPGDSQSRTLDVVVADIELLEDQAG